MAKTRHVRWSESLSEPYQRITQAERGRMLTARPQLKVSLIVSYLRKRSALHLTSKVGVHALRLTLWGGSIFAEVDRLGEFRASHMSAQFPCTHEWIVRGLPTSLCTSSIQPMKKSSLGIFHRAQAR
jgi:hypothetical protein